MAKDTTKTPPNMEKRPGVRPAQPSPRALTAANPPASAPQIQPRPQASPQRPGRTLGGDSPRPPRPTISRSSASTLPVSMHGRAPRCGGGHNVRAREVLGVRRNATSPVLVSPTCWRRQEYGPAGPRAVRYAFTFDIFGRASPRILVEEKGDLDLADLYGVMWYQYERVGYCGFWISRVDGHALGRREAKRLQDEVEGDFRFDYTEDELSLDFFPEPQYLRLRGTEVDEGHVQTRRQAIDERAVPQRTSHAEGRVSIVNNEEVSLNGRVLRWLIEPVFGSSEYVEPRGNRETAMESEHGPRRMRARLLWCKLPVCPLKPRRRAGPAVKTGSTSHQSVFHPKGLGKTGLRPERDGVRSEPASWGSRGDASNGRRHDRWLNSLSLNRSASS